MVYPSAWSEFEDSEDSFLFYDPDVWAGNFRISAYKGNPGYARECMRQELRENPSASPVKVGGWECVYSRNDFQEDGAAYTTHFWVTGADDMVVECSFTVSRGGAVAEAEAIIASLCVRVPGRNYPAELIPLRVLEMYRLNEACEWAASKMRSELKHTFQGEEADLDYLQKLLDEGKIDLKKRSTRVSLGLVLCSILANEVEGVDWCTYVDGSYEAPVIVCQGHTTDPAKLFDALPAGANCSLREIYVSALG